MVIMPTRVVINCGDDGDYDSDNGNDLIFIQLRRRRRQRQESCNKIIVKYQSFVKFIL